MLLCFSDFFFLQPHLGPDSSLVCIAPTLWSSANWEQRRIRLSCATFKIFIQLNSALKCSGARCALLYFGWSGDENGNVLIGFRPKKVCHVLAGISLLSDTAPSPCSSEQLAPRRGDHDKWLVLIISTLEWIGKEGHVFIHSAVLLHREGFEPRRELGWILAVGQVWTCLFIWFGDFYFSSVLCFFVCLWFFSKKNPICSNFLQLHNEVPFSDMQYPKVRESLAATK